MKDVLPQIKDSNQSVVDRTFVCRRQECPHCSSPPPFPRYDCVPSAAGLSAATKGIRWFGREIRAQRTNFDRLQCRDCRQLSHSTVWRWLSWLGSLKKLFQAGIRMVLEKDPKTDLHRKTYRIASAKYRPGGREKTLQDAARMLEWRARVRFSRRTTTQTVPLDAPTQVEAVSTGRVRGLGS